MRPVRSTALYVARSFKAFALTGRQVTAQNNPGRCPGLRDSAPTGRAGDMGFLVFGKNKRKGKSTKVEKYFSAFTLLRSIAYLFTFTINGRGEVSLHKSILKIVFAGEPVLASSPVCRHDEKRLSSLNVPSLLYSSPPKNPRSPFS